MAPESMAQFVRFLGVGVLNSAFGYAVFAGGVLLGMGAGAALIVAYVLGVIFNYFTTARLVFGGAHRQTFVKFVAAYVVIYAFNATLYHVVEMAGLPPLVNQALCIPVVAVFSFLLFKFHVFRPRTVEAESSVRPELDRS